MRATLLTYVIGTVDNFCLKYQQLRRKMQCIFVFKFQYNLGVSSLRYVVLAALAATAISTPAFANQFEGPRIEARLGFDKINRDKTDFHGVEGEWEDNYSIYDQSANGVTVGAGVGYDFGLTNRVTLGAEANIAFSNIKSEALSSWEDASYNVDREFEASARLGYKLSDHSLLYVKGGFANTSRRYQTVGERPNTYETERSGWTVGGGFETAVTKNVYAKVEYRYTDYGSNDPYSYVDGDYYEEWSDKLTRHNAVVAVGYRF